MSRSVGAVLVALLVAACALTPAPTATSVATQPPSPAAEIPAALTITGSGWLCGPWWFGCGAILAVEAPGWTLPDDWAPDTEDTRFDVEFDLLHDGPTKVTGVGRQGQDRIEPGQYRLVVIETRTSDVPSSGPLDASFGCAVDVTVPRGTRAVDVDVTFQSGCTIAVSMDGPTAAPS